MASNSPPQIRAKVKVTTGIDQRLTECVDKITAAFPQVLPVSTSESVWTFSVDRDTDLLGVGGPLGRLSYWWVRRRIGLEGAHFVVTRVVGDLGESQASSNGGKGTRESPPVALLSPYQTTDRSSPSAPGFERCVAAGFVLVGRAQTTQSPGETATVSSSTARGDTSRS